MIEFSLSAYYSSGEVLYKLQYHSWLVTMFQNDDEGIMIGLLVYHYLHSIVWEKSNDAYSLWIRVQTTINHICLFTTISTSKKMFFSERTLKKALRDTLTGAA